MIDYKTHNLGTEKRGCMGVHLDFTQLWRVDYGIVPNSIQHSQIVYMYTVLTIVK